MARSRSATATIKGYYYQFDYFILKLLNCQSDSDTVCIEGIEDVDVNTATETTAIQCKYYSGSEYNHSIIAEPLKFMLDHFLDETKPTIKYKLYGHYKSGQDKLPSSLTVDFFKSIFLKLKVFSEVGYDDKDIEDFLSVLEIDINAKDYDKQIACIIEGLMTLFNCNRFEAEYYFYNNSLRLIKELSVDSDQNRRTISKRDFLDQINKKETLFSEWFLALKDVNTYCSTIKTEHFTFTNLSPYERFFLIECDAQINNADIKTLLILIGNKYSKLSQREINTFCPYVYIHNLDRARLLNVLNALHEDNYTFIDGYEYRDASFSVKSISKQATYNNNIKLKIIYDLGSLNAILRQSSKTREIYQFHVNEAYYDNNNHKHVKVPISETNKIKKIL